MSPERIQWHNLIVQFRDGKLQEWICPARFEGHAKILHVWRPVDNVILTPEAHQPTVGAGRKGFSVIRLIRLDSAAEVDLQVQL